MEIIFENLSLDFESGSKNWILFKNSTFRMVLLQRIKGWQLSWKSFNFSLLCSLSYPLCSLSDYYLKFIPERFTSLKPLNSTP